jgi:type IV pilus assembly protein PilA
MSFIFMLRQRLESQKGFTLIELLVVILIIGILAAIAIPSFLNQREKGQDACAKSMVRSMQTALETVYISTNSYATGTPLGLATVESQVSDGKCGTGTTITTGAVSPSAGTCTSAAPAATSYCAAATSAAVSGGTHTFSVTRSATGAIARTCAPAGQGACVAAGTW